MRGRRCARVRAPRQALRAENRIYPSDYPLYCYTHSSPEPMLDSSPLSGFLHAPLLEAGAWRALACNDNRAGAPRPDGPEADGGDELDDFPAGLLTLY